MSRIIKNILLKYFRHSLRDLEAELVDYERQLEWEEGTAKYVEVAILKRAAETDGYQALPETEQDADFRGKEMDSRWSQELMQLRYQTTSGESRLYMTGMALAFLLDDLMPDMEGSILDGWCFSGGSPPPGSC